MNTYRTAEIAAIIGIHPNTVRLYEEWGLISKPKRKENGYRIFTDLHIQQIQLARTAFQIEVLQSGLRKKMVDMLKASAARDFGKAIILTHEYLEQLKREKTNAEDAIQIARQIMLGSPKSNKFYMKRKEASKYLGISMDTMRNWEMNGLLTVKRKENGYRVYMDDDIRRLKIIRSLRCANYSLEAILHLFSQLSKNPDTDIPTALNIPPQKDSIISVCDRLIISLTKAEKNAEKILLMLEKMKNQNF